MTFPGGTKLVDLTDFGMVGANLESGNSARAVKPTRLQSGLRRSDFRSLQSRDVGAKPLRNQAGNPERKLRVLKVELLESRLRNTKNQAISDAATRQSSGSGRRKKRDLSEQLTSRLPLRDFNPFEFTIHQKVKRFSRIAFLKESRAG